MLQITTQCMDIKTELANGYTDGHEQYHIYSTIIEWGSPIWRIFISVWKDLTWLLVPIVLQNNNYEEDLIFSN